MIAVPRTSHRNIVQRDIGVHTKSVGNSTDSIRAKSAFSVNIGYVREISKISIMLDECEWELACFAVCSSLVDGQLHLHAKCVPQLSLACSIFTKHYPMSEPLCAIGVSYDSLHTFSDGHCLDTTFWKKYQYHHTHIALG